MLTMSYRCRPLSTAVVSCSGVEAANPRPTTRTSPPAVRTISVGIANQSPTFAARTNVRIASTTAMIEKKNNAVLTVLRMPSSSSFARYMGTLRLIALLSPMPSRMR